jgi:hypothetical protein
VAEACGDDENKSGEKQLSAIHAGKIPQSPRTPRIAQERSQGNRMNIPNTGKRVLKGHDFSRAANAPEQSRALAPEGRF